MSDPSPRILFVPVSGPHGMGEFARSSTIALAVLERWPRASVHFVLSRKAPYAAGSPFPKTVLASSPTFHPEALIELMRAWRPHVVVFDNAGRTSQLRAAHELGARVVYISARRRQRSRAFRLRWMRLIDEHWIAYPKFLAGELGFFERLKLKLLKRPAVRYLDVILSRPAPQAPPRRANFVLVIPGGGTGHPGAADASEIFLAAARSLAASGFETKFVGPATIRVEAPDPPDFCALGALPQSELGMLMGSARLVVVNGGSTLLQSIACGAACVAVPIAGDQRGRIRRCVYLKVAVEAALSAPDIAAKASALLRDEPTREALAQRAAGLALGDGVEVALRALGRLIEA